MGGALAGTGYYFDTRVNAAKSDQNKIQTEYRASNDGFDLFAARFASAGKTAHQNAGIRDLLYGIGGVFGLGFLISLPF